MDYWQKVGTEKAMKVVKEAGTEWSYWKHIAHNRKRPGADLARRLVEASRKITPKHRLTLNELLTPREQIKGRVKATAANESVADVAA